MKRFLALKMKPIGEEMENMLGYLEESMTTKHIIRFIKADFYEWILALNIFIQCTSRQFSLLDILLCYLVCYI